jgi:hypothetical protein
MRRNIRITPYRFESVGDLVERHGFEECYCYSSDFPHPEGGTSPMQDFAKHIERLGQANAEKFYISNAKWVMPEYA